MPFPSVWLLGSLAALLALTMPGPLLHADQPTLTHDDLHNPAHPEISFALYEENDTAKLNPFHPADRHYTQGLAAALAFQPHWASDLAQAIPGGCQKPRAAATLIVAQLIFTPQNLIPTVPDSTDRPYAGYFFVGGLLQRRDAPGTSLDEFQIDLGVIGPSSLAEDIQIWFHKNIVDAQRPNGWNHQLKDEPTFQFTFRKKWRFDLTDSTPDQPNQVAAQAIPYAGFMLGTVKRNLEAGVTLRAGWKLPDDFGPGRLADPADATALRTNNTGWAFYAFTRLAARVVEHDTLISGSDFRSAPGAGVTEQPLVAEIQTGLSAAYRGDGWSLEVAYSQTYLTQEFHSQRGTDSYGSLTANLTWQF